VVLDSWKWLRRKRRRRLLSNCTIVNLRAATWLSMKQNRDRNALIVALAKIEVVGIATAGDLRRAVGLVEGLDGKRPD